MTKQYKEYTGTLRRPYPTAGRRQGAQGLAPPRRPQVFGDPGGIHRQGDPANAPRGCLPPARDHEQYAGQHRQLVRLQKTGTSKRRIQEKIRHVHGRLPRKPKMTSVDLDRIERLLPGKA